MRMAVAPLVLVAAASAIDRNVGVEQTYAASRLYGAGAAFSAANMSRYLRQVRPQVLRFELGRPTLIDLNLGNMSGPASLGIPAHDREMGIFNPALVPAPKRLCPRCAYVVALRVDPLHQCHENSPLLKTDPNMPTYTAANAWFKGTAIAVLDAQLKVLGWTWLLNAPLLTSRPLLLLLSTASPAFLAALFFGQASGAILNSVGESWVL